MSQWATGPRTATFKQSFSEIREKKAHGCTTYSHIAIKIIYFFSCLCQTNMREAEAAAAEISSVRTNRKYQSVEVKIMRYDVLSHWIQSSPLTKGASLLPWTLLSDLFVQGEIAAPLH